MRKDPRRSNTFDPGEVLWQPRLGKFASSSFQVGDRVAFSPFYESEEFTGTVRGDLGASRFIVEDDDLDTMGRNYLWTVRSIMMEHLD